MPRDYTQTPAAAARRVALRRRLTRAGTPLPLGASFADLLRAARRCDAADAANAAPCPECERSNGPHYRGRCDH